MTGVRSEDELHRHFEELFSPLGDIRVRRMFGGAGIYADGVMFGLLADGRLFLKSGPTNEDAFDALGLAPFNYGRAGKTVRMSYREAPESVYEDPDQAERWGRLALREALSRRRP